MTTNDDMKAAVIRKLTRIVETLKDGYDVELRKDSKAGVKVIKVKKKEI